MKVKYDLGRVEVHKRTRLPHWEIETGVQFITFHEFDAVPRPVREQIELEADEELRRLRISGSTDPEEIRKVVERSRRRINLVLDESHGRCTLRQPDVAALVRDSILFHDTRSYDLLSWSVMPNHVHMVVGVTGVTMADFLASLKGFTSREINKLTGRRGPFWAENYFDRAMRGPDQLERTLRYVANNPTAAGLLQWEFAASYPERIARYLA